MKTKWLIWLSAGLLVATGMAGCDARVRSANEARAEIPEVAVPRPPTPEEAMQLPIPTPLAASTENWIADTDLGDAWEQAKSQVASLRFRLVQDYERRMESGVGETQASRTLRKDYLRWVRIHDELKEFILTCQTHGTMRELPPKLAENIKDWRHLRQESQNTVDIEIERWQTEADSLRREFARLQALGDAAGSGNWERLADRVREGRTSVESLRARTDAVSWQYAADGRMAGLADRVARLSSEWGELSREVEGMALRQNDMERLEEFAAACGRMRMWMRTLSDRVEAKNARIAEEKALARSLRQSRPGGGAAAAARFRAEMERDHADGNQALRDIKDFRRYFDDKAFGKFLRGFSEGSRAALSSHLEDVKRAVPVGRNPDTYLNNLENKAKVLRDMYEEKAALAILENDGRR